ncbi:MAG TPA: MFS transporter [Dehalococcoidia bacterium]|nr:MFS transporter [Dehalococcoidia bacterium]
MSCPSPPPRAAHTTLRALLLSTTLLDELTIGFLVVGLPLLRERLHFGYAQAGFVFTFGALVSLAVEPFVNLLADRGSKRTPILLGMAGVVAGFALAGAAPSYVWLLAAFALISPACGVAVGLAEAALVDLDPAAAGRTMARWALSGAAGDLLAPACVGVLTAAGLRWPALSAAAACCWLALLATTWPLRFPASHTAAEQESEMSTAATLRAALGDRVLLRWAAVEVAAIMMDEVFLAFAALYLRDRLHASPALLGFSLLPGTLAALLALAALERVGQRLPHRPMLTAMALAALGGIALLLLAPSLPAAVPGLVVAQAGAAGWYPIARAAAFARYPGRSGLVRAVLSVTDPFELVLPTIVGFVAAGAGIRGAVAFLGLAPLLVLAAAPRD